MLQGRAVDCSAKECCGKRAGDAHKCLDDLVAKKIEYWMKSLYNKHSETYYLATGNYADSFKNETLSVNKLCSVHLNYDSHPSLFGMMREGQFNISITRKNGQSFKTDNPARQSEFKKTNNYQSQTSGYFDDYLNNKVGGNFRYFLAKELTSCLGSEFLKEDKKQDSLLGPVHLLNKKNGPSCVK